MIVFDTNVVSEAMRPNPDPRVLAWFDSVPRSESHITIITVGELLSGVLQLPRGRKRNALHERVDDVIAAYRGRILSADPQSAPLYAEIRAARRRDGRPIGVSDAWVAAVCRRHGVPLATRNVADFEGTGIAVVDPWESDPA